MQLRGLRTDHEKHFDNKPAENETEETREARKAEYATLTRHYYNLATDLVQYFSFNNAFERANQ